MLKRGYERRGDKGGGGIQEMMFVRGRRKGNKGEGESLCPWKLIPPKHIRVGKKDQIDPQIFFWIFNVII